MTGPTGAAARVQLAAATVAAAALALAGCSSSPAPTTSLSQSSSDQSLHAASAPAMAGGSTTAAGSAPAGSARAAGSITIKNFAYRVSGPVAPGAPVQVTNDDSIEHTVTADSGHGFDVAVPPGKTATFAAPPAIGRHRFHCDFHSDMHGTLTVK